MTGDALHAALTARLASEQGDDLESIVRAVLDQGPSTAAGVASLLDELEERSAKARKAARTALPEFCRRGVADAVVSWLDLGVALAESSGATALKYFQESPLLLALLATPAVRQQVLAQALELADRDANIALEYLRQAPALVAALPAGELARWCEIGLELAECDYVLGVEFFRQSHAIVPVVRTADLRDWIAFAMKLVTQNSLGKTDYVGTLEFLRTSPALLGEVAERLRKPIIDLGSVLANRDPEAAIRYLADCPSMLARIPSEEWAAKILALAVFVAERDTESCLAYLQRSADVVAQADRPDEIAPLFDQWFRGGMDVLELSTEGGRAYFALETHKAVSALEEGTNAVPLRQVARTLKLFVDGLSGKTISLEPLPEAVDGGNRTTRPTVTEDGRTILLPARMSRYADREQNRRLYIAMVAHEAGHLEFGTYDLRLGEVDDIRADAVARYHGHADVHSLQSLFDLYPQPRLMQDLWTLLEDARVECVLQHCYPGLAADLVSLAREAVTTRSLTHGLTVKELVVDCLLLLTTTEPSTVKIPDAIEPIMSRVWDLTRPVLRVTATAEDAVRAAHQIYVLLDEMVAAPNAGPPATPTPDVASEAAPSPAASEESGGTYRPVTNWGHRGDMNPAMVGRGTRPADEETETRTDGTALAGPGDPPRMREGTTGAVTEDRREHEDLGASPELVPAQTDVVGAGGASATRHGNGEVEGTFLYDEWDGLIRDYRSRWCRVVERPASGADSDFVDATLARYGALVRLVRRSFESVRLTALRRMFAQIDGEDLDLDATIRRVVDRAAGAEPSERVYVRRERRERDVAVAFLVDLSGSTSRQLEGDGRRVIDVEKEALILLTEALEAIGDQYAIYGYSSRGRRAVDFLVLKDFDDLVVQSSPRIGALAPLQQNRDGAAIRHAVRKLRGRQARTRLLILISDGRPLDEGYADEYALEDTKKALQEARMGGIHPFCMTVDHHADQYLRRMYGDVHYLVIDEAATLPARLPRLYQRLTA